MTAFHPLQTLGSLYVVLVIWRRFLLLLTIGIAIALVVASGSH